MKRISPEEIVAAYKKTGLEYIDGDWGHGHCACPLTALAVANGLDDVNPANSNAVSGKKVMDHLQSIGYDVGYMKGFQCGVDGGEPLDFEGFEESGAEDGFAASRQCYDEIKAGSITAYDGDQYELEEDDLEDEDEEY